MSENKTDTEPVAAKKKIMPTSPGRPKLEIDEDLVRDLARIHCTNQEIASIVHCTSETIGVRFSELIKDARNEGKMSLRREQFKCALKGNVTMLIWLGKHILGQDEEKADAVRTSADEILAYIRGRMNHEESGQFRHPKKSPK